MKLALFYNLNFTEVYISLENYLKICVFALVSLWHLSYHAFVQSNYIFDLMRPSGSLKMLFISLILCQNPLFEFIWVVGGVKFMKCIKGGERML
jgi:hypothetical protein